MSPSEINHQVKDSGALSPLASQSPREGREGSKVSFLGRSWSSVQNPCLGEPSTSSHFLRVVAKIIIFCQKNVGRALPEKLKILEFSAAYQDTKVVEKKEEAGIQVSFLEKIKELLFLSKATEIPAQSHPSDLHSTHELSSEIPLVIGERLKEGRSEGVSAFCKENAEAAVDQQRHQVAKRHFVIDLTLDPKAMNVVTVRKKCYRGGDGVVIREFNYGVEGREKEINGRHVGVSSSTGARSQMEDTALALRDEVNGEVVEIYGVFDGHGGSDCAQYSSDHLGEYFRKAIEGKDLTDDEGIASAIKNCFEEMESNFYLEKDLTGGATAVTVFIVGDHLWVANIGDSRAILVKSDGAAVQATEDAKPEIPKFKKQIILHGGSVQQRPGDIPRVNGQLAVARSLGDSNHFKGVTSKAELTRFSLKDFAEGTLVLACDGLWDVATTDQVGAAVGAMNSAGWDAKAMSQALVYHAIGQGSQDNVTVLVVPLLNRF